MVEEDDRLTLPDADDPSIHHELRGAIVRHYRELGGETVLGLPKSDERELTEPHLTRHGDRGMDFEGGWIILERGTGEPILFRFRTYDP